MTATTLVELPAHALQWGDVVVTTVTVRGNTVWTGERSVDSLVCDGAMVWVDFTDGTFARFTATAVVMVRRP